MNDFYATLKIQHGPLRQAIQSAGFKTPLEMCKTIGVDSSKVYELLNFKSKPINLKTGKWRDNVLKICSFLGFSPEELFPEHLQKIVATNRFETFASANALPSAEPPTAQLPPYEAMDQEALRSLINSAIGTLSKTEQDVLKMSFIEGETDANIARKMKRPNPRGIRPIRERALRKLRHPKTLRMLNEAHLLIESIPA